MNKFEAITGKYVHVIVHGVDYRVYFEENGTGIPLVCQHTAGSDGRQWRHLLNDQDITSKFRVIVPDLPYHDKSLPPESIDWWAQEYKLTKQFIIEFHLAFYRTLGIEKPVYIGTSMGGHLACDLALEQPQVFRALIGVEASEHTKRSTKFLEWMYHPRINTTFEGMRVYSLMAPTSPEKYRRETAWEYIQAAPGINKGDAYYYFMDHDLTGKLELIDTSKVPLYFLTGDYDASVCPEDTRLLANQIKGSKFVEMNGIGHFAMSENFEVFKRYLMPVLNEIAGK